MQEREKFGSRLGFVLISAGCAIGLGNVWRFPYIVGQYGGAAFVLIYLFFLAILGLPVMAMEFSVGRASQKSIARSFQVLEPAGTKWHWHGWVGMIGNYILMMFYTTVAGWMFIYFFKSATGAFEGLDAAAIGTAFDDVLANPGLLAGCMFLVVVLGMAICCRGLQNGVEKFNKIMMLALLALLVLLAIRAVTLEGAGEGLSFYLVPKLDTILEIGISEVVFAALGQAFFTLSIGMGSMAIFGSYIGKEHTLLGEALNVTLLDTFVAIIAGLIIFPSCYAFGVSPDQGPSLIFVTLPNVFNAMPGGRIWGSLFFVFMSFAAMSTVIGVFQNLLACTTEAFGISHKKSIAINFVLITVLSLPCLLGFSVLSDVTILGMGILDFEDFLVSNNILPLGSLVYLAFCVSKCGWGWDNFLAEANQGKGLKFPRQIRFYVTWVIPALVLYVFAMGYYDKFF